MTLGAHTVDATLEAIAARTPVPGGGAVASLTGGLAAALARMVVRYSQGKKKLADHAGLHDEALARLETLGRRAVELAAADAEAYGRLNELWKLADDDPRRRAGWDDAVTAAIAAPEAVLDLGLDLLDLLVRLTGATSRMLRSDLAIAAVLAEAAARSAAWNIRINLPQVSDPDVASRLEQTVADRLARAGRSCRSVEHACSI